MNFFVSYRREDSIGWTGRLVGDLRRSFGESNVFQDIDMIAPGRSFRSTIDERLSRSDIVIVVIGPNWTNTRVPDGSQRRLDEENDLVRYEVASSLKTDKPVIPLLVGDAHLPMPSDLPEDLKGLLDRQSAILSDRTWDLEIQALIAKLRRSNASQNNALEKINPPDLPALKDYMTMSWESLPNYEKIDLIGKVILTVLVIILCGLAYLLKWDLLGWFNAIGEVFQNLIDNTMDFFNSAVRSWPQS